MRRRQLSVENDEMHVVPAAPGYFVVYRDGDVISKDAVVAWGIDRDSYQPYPITLYGVQIDSPCILHPDGRVDRLGLESYESIELWMADRQRVPVESNG